MLTLKKLREEKGLTQAELGKALKISPSAIGMYEQGRRFPDVPTLKKISSFFNVTIDFLLENSDNPHPTTDTANIQDVPADEAEAAALYKRLDTGDRGEIRGTMKQMLKADKYQPKVGVQAG